MSLRSPAQKMLDTSFGIVMGLVIATVVGLYLTKEDDIEDVETNELSMYVGNFDSIAELRRIDDLERGTSCYYIYKTISCVYTGDFGNQED